MSHHPDHHEHLFEKLMNLAESGESDALFAQLLHEGPTIVSSLTDFLIRQPNHPRIAVLIDLLGKIGDPSSFSIFMRFLDIPISELQKSAALALGWNRARVGLEKLDEMVGTHPDDSVRREAALAIEEILEAFPFMRNQLHHHVLTEPRLIEEAPAPSEAEIRARLEASPSIILPRMLAARHAIIPVVREGNASEFYCLSGQASTALPVILSFLELNTGVVNSLVGNEFKAMFDKHYFFGDDDFTLVKPRIKPEGFKALSSAILEEFRPDEPACPLNEASDGVEAALSLLACFHHWEVFHAHVTLRPDLFSIEVAGRGQDFLRQIVSPDIILGSRMITVLRLVAGLDPYCKPGIRAEGRLSAPSSKPVLDFQVVSTEEEGRSHLKFGRLI